MRRQQSQGQLALQFFASSKAIKAIFKLAVRLPTSGASKNRDLICPNFSYFFCWHLYYLDLLYFWCYIINFRHKFNNFIQIGIFKFPFYSVQCFLCPKSFRTPFRPPWTPCLYKNKSRRKPKSVTTNYFSLKNGFPHVRIIWRWPQIGGGHSGA